jgi:hypothetical protein
MESFGKAEHRRDRPKAVAESCLDPDHEPPIVHAESFQVIPVFTTSVGRYLICVDLCL